jgi:hypothetical protein
MHMSMNMYMVHVNLHVHENKCEHEQDHEHQMNSGRYGCLYRLGIQRLAGRHASSLLAWPGEYSQPSEEYDMEENPLLPAGGETGASNPTVGKVSGHLTYQS